MSEHACLRVCVCVCVSGVRWYGHIRTGTAYSKWSLQLPESNAPQPPAPASPSLSSLGRHIHLKYVHIFIPIFYFFLFSSLILIFLSVCSGRPVGQGGGTDGQSRTGASGPAAQLSLTISYQPVYSSILPHFYSFLSCKFYLLSLGRHSELELTSRPIDNIKLYYIYK